MTETLDFAYDNRLYAARAYAAAGGAIVGTWSGGIPEILLHATGHMPVEIAPDTGRGRAFSSAWFEEGMEPGQDAALDQLLSGELSFLRLAIFGSQGEEDGLLYHSAKEVLRLSHGGMLPPLHLHVALGARDEAAMRYSVDQVRRLARRLFAASGIEATPDRLAAAAATLAERATLATALHDLRLDGRIGGAEALRAIGAGRFMALEDHIAGLRALVGTVAARDPAGRPALLLAASADCVTTTLHAAIAQGGAEIVAEDDRWGSRAFPPPPALDTGDDAAAIARNVVDHVPCRAVYPHTLRWGWFYEMARDVRIDALVVHMAPSDTALGWDWPRLEAFACSIGKPILMLRDDPASPEGAARVAAATADFTARMRP